MGQATLGVVEFGAELLRTEDLDPVYVALHKANLPLGQLKRWLLGYWCFYHAGVASLLSEEEGLGFYRTLERADRERWPRGRERRHFRGQTSATAIGFLNQLFRPPERATDSLTAGGGDDGLTFRLVSDRIQSWPGFGPWIAFKAADMLERLGLAEIRFELSDLLFYSEPAAGAVLAGPQLEALGHQARTLAEVCEALAAELSAFRAPPRLERFVGVQEVETILCKWKGHVRGHYPVGLDTREIRHALEARDWGATARRFRDNLPV